MDASAGQSGTEARRFSLLDSVGAVFAHNETERQNRLAKQRSKHQAELEHSRYLRTILPTNELAQAKSVVNQWAKKHGTKYSSGNLNRPLSPRNRLHPRGVTASPPRARVEMARLNSPLRTRSRSPVMPRSPLARVQAEQDLVVISDDDSVLDEEAQIKLAIQRSLEEAGVEGQVSPPGTSQADIICLDTSSEVVGDVLETTPSSGVAAPGSLRCSVFECEIQFSCAARLAEHRASLKHSSCDPALLLTDGRLPDPQPETMCPYCVKVFTEEASCLTHKCPKFGDLPFAGIGIAGYMCPQCLMILQDSVSCESHIVTAKHNNYNVPFTEDFLSLRVVPVPVSPGFARHFVAQCRSVDSALYCADCSSEVTGEHTESHPDHIVSASASNDLLDVFMEYLCSCQCERCWMIFATSEASVGDIHRCGRGEEGVVRSTNVRSFSQLLRLLGLRFLHDSVTATLRKPTSPRTAARPASSPMESLSAKAIPNEHSSEPSTSIPKQCHRAAIHPPKQKVVPANHHPRQNIPPLFGTHPPSYAQDSNSFNRQMYGQRLFTHDRFHNSHTRSQGNGQNRRFGSHRYFEHREARNHFNRNPAKNSYSKGPPEQRSNSGFGAKTFHPPSGVPSLRVTNDSHVSAQAAPPSATVLSTMKLLIFLDLDNWQGFFRRLPRCLPDLTFVWAFYGGATVWREPNGFCAYTQQKMKGLFHLNKKSGRTKDAADMSLVLQVGTMNALLPKTVPFTILSGDKAFCQLEQDLQTCERRLVVIDPHLANKQSADLFYTQIISVFQA